MTKLKNRLLNRKGFTLIELIVVIAIIAILAAVLIPRFTGFTKDARQKGAISDTRNILVAVEALYANGDTGITVTEVEGYTGVAFSGTLSFSDGTPLAIGAGGTYTFTYTKDGHVVSVANGEITGAT